MPSYSGPMPGYTGPRSPDGPDAPTTVLSAPGEPTSVLRATRPVTAPTPVDVTIPVTAPTEPVDRFPTAPAGGPGAAPGGAGDPAATWGLPWQPDLPAVGSVPPASDAAAAAPAPLVGRREAAEIGLYVGALLVLVALASAVLRGWGGWDATLRWSTAGLSAVALVAAGLFARLGRGNEPSGQRRRAVSALLTGGTGIALVELAVLVGPQQGVATPGSALLAGVAVLATLGCAAAARTPLSESGLLLALGWAAWLVVPAGPALWAGLAGLGVAWVLLGARWARGRRTSGVAGSLVALAAAVPLASGAWAWPTRAALATVMVVGLVRFLRGGAPRWLALAAGCALAVAVAVAGELLGPALALLVGGVATMGVSWLALRSTPRA